MPQPKMKCTGVRAGKIPDAAHTWKQMEDRLIPQLKLSLTERAVYSCLVRHSRLEGHRRHHFSIGWLARKTLLTYSPARNAVRRMAEKGVLRLAERSKAGHFVDVFLPDEIRACRRDPPAPPVEHLEAVDFMHSPVYRNAIRRREDSHCFYCLRFLHLRALTLDHVVPRVKQGRNSYRNLVACCTDCNSQKGEGHAEDLLRKLFRQGRLNMTELAGRRAALRQLAAGNLKPQLKPLSSTGRR